MQTFRSRAVSAMSLFWRTKVSQIDHLFIEGDLGDNSAVAERYALRKNSPRLRSFVGLAIRPILPARRLAQILYAVVKPVSINVVNLVFRPNPVVHKPRKPVGLVDGPAYRNPAVAFVVNMTGDLARLNLRSVLVGYLPKYDARFRVIRQSLMDNLCFGHPHRVGSSDIRVKGL